MATVAEILLAQGQHAADSRRHRGALWGQTIAGLSQVPGQIIADREAQRAAQFQAGRQQRADQRDEVDVGIRASKEDRERADAARALEAEKNGEEAVEAWVEKYRTLIGDEYAARVLTAIKMPGGLKTTLDTLMKAPEPFTLSPGQTRFDSTGAPRASVPEKAPTPKQYEVVIKGPNGRPVKKLVTEGEMQGGVEQYEKPDTSPAQEPLVAIMRGGKPILVRRSQAEGQTPATTREQGRQVTDTTAGQLAEYDTSLDDLAVLRTTVSGNKATGARAKAGAMLPNAVTEFTGWGADAKSKQAVIDRVKQVIGKALEGGVLRKEDEVKYTKILPTIGDPPSVVETKLAGLETAIKLRRQREIDAREDAGYDVSQFRAREAVTPQKPVADPLGLFK